MKILALTIGDTTFTPPSGVPSGGAGTLWSVLRTGIQFIFIIAILIAAIFLVFNGLRWLTSEGDKQKVQNARNGLAMTVLGLVIIFLAFFLVNVIGKFFGIDLLGTGI